MLALVPAPSEIRLRDYQQRSIDELRNKIAAGIKRTVLLAPTGSGKTVIAAEIVRLCRDRGNSIMFVCHRRELVDQTVDKLAAFGVEAGVVMAADYRTNSALPVQVCSIQTLSRRLDRLPEAAVLIFDEVHHAASNSWRALLDKYPGTVVIGLTATPWRTDKIGLRELFEDFILVATPSELIASGSLVQFDAYAYDAPDLHTVGIVAGEYNQGELELACNTQILVGSAVKEYCEHAMGRPAIVFPVSIAHSQALVEEFKKSGVTAEHIDFKTAAQVRRSALERFRSGGLTVISSVGILTEGFDAPVAELAILCRPTKSLSLHLQMIGRVLRPSPGKQRASFHDHAGNLLRHGLPDEERDWSLTNTPVNVLRKHVCPACHFFFTGLRNNCCPNCGEALAAESAQSEGGERDRTKEQIDGRRIDMDEIRRRRAEAGITRELSDQQLVKVLNATRREKIAEYKRLHLVAVRKGFKEGFVAHQFRAVFSHWPRFSAEELSGVDPATKPFLPLPRKH